jgi:hypothetical protein
MQRGGVVTRLSGVVVPVGGVVAPLSDPRNPTQQLGPEPGVERTIIEAHQPRWPAANG